MIVKNTYSIPEALDFDAEGIANTQGKQLAGPCELSFMKLNVLEAGGAVVSIFDGTSASDENNANLKLVMDAGDQTPDVQTFVSPLIFRRGIWARLDQGANLTVVLSYAVMLPR